MDKGDRKVLKVICIKSEKLRDPITLHRRDKPGIMRSDALDSQILHQRVPSRQKFLAIREQCESPLKEKQPLARLLDPHPKSVLSGGRRTCLACCDGPNSYRFCGTTINRSRFDRRSCMA